MDWPFYRMHTEFLSHPEVPLPLSRVRTHTHTHAGVYHNIQTAPRPAPPPQWWLRKGIYHNQACITAFRPPPAPPPQWWLRKWPSGDVVRISGDYSFPNHTNMLSFDFAQAAPPPSAASPP